MSRVIQAAVFAGSLFAIASSASAAENALSYKTLPHCLAAYEYERGQGMDANARATKASFNSAEESNALDEQSVHFKKASEIKAACDKMEKDQRPLADQVRELSGELDGLGPISGSMRTPVAGAIREGNLKTVGTKMEGVAGTLDATLKDFQSANLGSRSTSPSLPPLGATAAASLSADVASWRKEEDAREAEGQRLAAIEAERRAEAQRIAFAEQQAAAEQRASSGGGFMDILGGLAQGALMGVAMKQASRRSSSQETYSAPVNSGSGSVSARPPSVPSQVDCGYNPATGEKFCR